MGVLRTTRTLAVLLPVFGGLGFAGAAQAESTLHMVEKRGTLLAGVTYDSPPTGSLDAQGHVTGFGPDVARYMAERLGVKIKFVQVTHATRIPLLQTDRIDAEFAVTTGQKVRDEVVDFTYSYIWDNGILLVRKGESLNPKDYMNSSKIIGSTQGNGFVSNWRKLSPHAKFKLYQEEPDVVLALKKKDVDAYLVGSFVGGRFAAKSNGELVMSNPWRPNPCAIMLRENDSKWRDWLDWALQRMWLEGSFAKLYHKWYGIEPNFKLGDDGVIQQRVEQIAKKNDPWHPLPAGYLDKLLGDKSYTLQ